MAMEGDMEGLEGRLAKIETMLQIALENQETSKDRYHRVANAVQETSSRMLLMEKALEEILRGKAEFTKLEDRVSSLEGTREKTLFGWSVIKWVVGVMGAFFTLSLAVGEKVMKFWAH